MATTTPTNASNVYDLVSWAKLRDPSLNAAKIAELLNQSNEMVQDIVWTEGNLPTGCRITQRTGLPTTYYRQINQPVSVSRGETAQIDEATAIQEAWSETDNDLLSLWADKGSFLYQQSYGFMEAMTQAFASTFWYGDTTATPTKFLGMAPRYSTVNTSTAANAQNVIDGGGTASANTSVWLLTHAPYALAGIFPKGSAAGITHEAKEDQVIYGTAGVGGTRMLGHQERWQWKAGLALWDWRWCVRVANIDVNNLTAENGAADVIKLMIKAMYRLPSIATPPSTTGNPMTSLAIPGRQAFYCNRTVREMLHIQALNKTSNQLVMEDYEGRKVMTFMGIPIRNSDQLINTEGRVT